MRGNLHTPKTHRSRTPCCSIVFLRKIDRMHHMVYNHPLNICLPLPYPGTCSRYLICALPSIRLQYKRSKRLNINNEELTFVLSNEGMIFNDMICSKHVGCELDFKIKINPRFPSHCRIEPQTHRSLAPSLFWHSGKQILACIHSNWTIQFFDHHSFLLTGRVRLRCSLATSSLSENRQINKQNLNKCTLLRYLHLDLYSPTKNITLSPNLWSIQWF